MCQSKIVCFRIFIIGSCKLSLVFFETEMHATCVISSRGVRGNTRVSENQASTSEPRCSVKKKRELSLPLTFPEFCPSGARYSSLLDLCL